MSRPIPVHPELTAVAIKAPVPGMIADQVLPEFPVTSEKFTYNEFPYAQGVTVPDTKVGRKSRTPEVEFGAEERESSTEDHGLQDTVPISDQTANTNIDPEAVSAEMTSQLVTLAREQRTAALVFNPASYVPAQITAYAAGAGWTNPATDVLGQFEDAKDAMVVNPNTLTVGLDGLRALRKHPQLVKSLRPNDTGEGRLTMDELKELLEIETILIGQAQLNLGRPGQDPSLRRVWADHASLTFTERVIKNSKAYTFGATARLGGKQAFRHFDANCGLQGGKALADQLNSLSKTFGIDLTKVGGLYTTIGKTEGGNAKALGGDGFFGGAINGVGSLAGQKDVKGLTLGKGVGFSQGQDAEVITEQIIRDTILRAINAGASDLSEAEKRFVAAAESLDEAVTYIEKSRGFMASIEDGILQFTDPAAFEKKKALDAIEASYQALKTEATAMVSAGLISADVMARLDELKRLQVEDALKKLAGSAGDATSALARVQPGLREWLDRQMLGANAPLNPLEQRNEAFRQYEDVLTRAVAGDGDALSSLTDYADRLLSADRLATSDASARALLFEEVMADVRALASKSTVDPVAAAIADLGETLSTDPVVAAIENLPAALLPALGGGGTAGGGASSTELNRVGQLIEASLEESARRNAANMARNGQDISQGLNGLGTLLQRLIEEVRTNNSFQRQASARVN